MAGAEADIRKVDSNLSAEGAVYRRNQAMVARIAAVPSTGRGQSTAAAVNIIETTTTNAIGPRGHTRAVAIRVGHRSRMTRSAMMTPTT